MPSALAMLLAATVTINASDAQTLLESARAMQAERWADVDNYTVTVSVEASGGLETPLYFEKMEVDGQPTFRMVSPAEYNRKLALDAGFPPPEEVAAGMAPGLDMLGDALAAGGGDMPPMDLRGMTSQMSMFARAAATATVSDGKAEATDAMHDFAEFAARAKLKGLEQVQATGGENPQMAEAYLLVADDVSDIALDQPKDDIKFTLSKVSLWLEKDHLVPLRLLMEGEAEADGKTRPLTIEKLDLDYRQVGPLYESHRQEFRLGGLMGNLTEKEQKELAKAKEEMAEMKAKLAQMPPAQQAMIEKMMKGQMEKFEAMSAGDAITTATNVRSIAINEGPPTAAGPGNLVVGGPAAATFPGALTVAADDPNAQLAIAAMLPGGAEAVIGLEGIAPFPKSGQVEIGGASGHVQTGSDLRVSVEGGAGTITVTERTPTRIVGTFTALLKGMSSTSEDTVHFSAEGNFDTGAPASAIKSFRGSPIPADLFEQP